MISKNILITDNLPFKFDRFNTDIRYNFIIHSSTINNIIFKVAGITIPIFYKQDNNYISIFNIDKPLYVLLMKSYYSELIINSDIYPIEVSWIESKFDAILLNKITYYPLQIVYSKDLTLRYVGNIVSSPYIYLQHTSIF